MCVFLCFFFFFSGGGGGGGSHKQFAEEPFETVSDETLWHPQLAATKPSKLFMSLLL